jgi:hypothetical protein
MCKPGIKPAIAPNIIPIKTLINIPPNKKL